MIEFNVNHYVLVKLTETGRAELERQHKELREAFPQISSKPSMPKENDEGFSKWQLHSLMNTFGHMMTPGFEVPFDPVIKFEPHN